MWWVGSPINEVLVVPFPFAKEATGGSNPKPVNNQSFPEGLIRLPWVVDPGATWLAYRNWIENELDPGMALHKPLPTAAATPDTLAQVDLGTAAVQTKSTGSGVNLSPGRTYRDVLQRMATSTYRPLMRGWALRAAFQVPIPGLVSYGGVPAVPQFPQRAYNVLAGTLPGGIPLWYAQWELAYSVTGVQSTPGQTGPVPENPALLLRPDAELPETIRLPWTQPDQRFGYATFPGPDKILGDITTGTP